MRHKSTALGRATLKGYAGPARMKYALPRGSHEGQEEERMQDLESLAHVQWECKYDLE